MKPPKNLLKKQDEIIRLLTIMTRLLAMKIKENRTTMERICTLHRLGLSTREIAVVLDTSNALVRRYITENDSRYKKVEGGKN